MISRRTGAAFSRSRQVTKYRRMGRDLEVLSTWALQLCTTRPAPDRAVSGRSISCSASERSAAILPSSTELPRIEPSSSAISGGYATHSRVAHPLQDLPEPAVPSRLHGPQFLAGGGV